MVEFEYRRRINYYETDKMGIVHHSNYIVPIFYIFFLKHLTVCNIKVTIYIVGFYI